MHRCALPRLLAIFVALGFAAIFAAACGDDTTPTDTGSDTDDGSDTGDGSDDSGDANPDQPIGGGPYPIADLTFEIRPDGTEASSYSYRLSCLGDTATLDHDLADGEPSDAAAMCLVLDDEAVRQRLLEGAPADQVCTEQYGGPDTAHVTGALDDIAVDTMVDRANGCGIHDWDTLLGGLLPPGAGLVG